MPKSINQKIVLSASRRVDLLTFYPDFFCQKINEFDLKNIHTLVIWTKNPANIFNHKELYKTLNKLDQLFILLTATGLGGTQLEPKAPKTEEFLPQLPRLIDFVKSPQRIAIRYDPLIDIYYQDKIHINNIDLNLFQNILNQIAPLGISRIITSYVTLYPKVIKRLRKYNFQMVSHTLNEIKDFIKNQMISLCQKSKIDLSTCVFPDLTTLGCIDGFTLTQLHPQKHPCSITKDPSQRPTCHCTKSVDIGQWFSCYHGCFYCYGNPEAPESF